MKQWRIVHTEASEGLGGQELRVLAELEWMRSRGHAVWLWAPRQAKIFQKAQQLGIPVEALDSRGWKLPMEALRLARWLRRNRVDILNTHSSRDSWIGGLAGRLARTPLVVRSRHIEVEYPHRWQSAILNDAWADLALTTSERIRTGLIRALQLDPARVHCVPTGIDLQKFHPNVTSTLRAELGLAPDAPLIGQISVLRSWKGHPVFLEAAKVLLEKIPQAHFVIAGDGPQRERLEGLAREMGLTARVHFLGHRSDVPNILAALDVVVLASTAHEGIPQILLQAQAMAKAIVASDVGGIPEIIEHEKTGLLVPAKNAGALAGAAQRLLLDWSLHQSLGIAALHFAQTRHSAEMMGRRLEGLYAGQLMHQSIPTCPSKSAHTFFASKYSSAMARAASECL